MLPPSPSTPLFCRPTGGLTDYAADNEDDDAFLALMIRSLCQSLIGFRWGESLSLCISSYLVPNDSVGIDAGEHTIWFVCPRPRPWRIGEKFW